MNVRPPPGPSWPHPSSPPPRRRAGAIALGVGIAAAGLFGLAMVKASGGFFALEPSRDAPSGPPLSVVVDRGEPPPPVAPERDAGPLDTFAAPPPDSDRPVPVRPVVRAAIADPPAPEPRPVRRAPPPTPEAQRAAFRPSFDCRYARSRAEQMVCGDPRLAAADRALHQVFEAAMRRAPDPRALRAEQDRWLAVRERAAPDPDAVAAVYHQRIDELEAAF